MHTEAEPGALISVKDILAAARISRSEIYRLLAAGKFPRPIVKRARFVRWRASDIAAWLDNPEGWSQSA